MNRQAALLSAAAIVLAGLVACDRARPIVQPANFPTVDLNRAIDARLGGPGTCVVLTDVASGSIHYQYGAQRACMRPLPPCGGFEIVNSLIALDLGLVGPDTVLQWDGRRQPVTAWERDADLPTAFVDSIGWWHQSLALKIGPERYGEQLKAYSYGSESPDGPLDSFWMGPAQGGGLQISTREQADFLHRLYSGALPSNPRATAIVQDLMAPRPGGAASGKSASCDSVADGSRSVGWWLGRAKSPEHDLAVAVSVESERAVPGFEVQSRMQAILGSVGLARP